MYKRILVPLDGSPIAEQALPHAISAAKKYGAELILLRVLEPFPQVRGLSLADATSLEQQSHEWAQKYLDGLVTEIEEQGISVRTVVVPGRPNTTILHYAEQDNTDLIVICSRGRSGLSRWLMGSVADRVVRGATRPVLLVRAQKEPVVH